MLQDDVFTKQSLPKCINRNYRVKQIRKNAITSFDFIIITKLAGFCIKDAFTFKKGTVTKKFLMQKDFFYFENFCIPDLFNIFITKELAI